MTISMLIVKMKSFTPGMNGIDTIDIEKWLLAFCEDKEWIKDEFYFIAHWRRYAIYKKEVYDDSEEWCLEGYGVHHLLIGIIIKMVRYKVNGQHLWRRKNEV
jgi:hypothetical protein